MGETARKSHNARLGGQGIEQQKQAECAQAQEDLSQGHVSTAEFRRKGAAAPMLRMEHTSMLAVSQSGGRLDKGCVQEQLKLVYLGIWNETRTFS